MIEAVKRASGIGAVDLGDCIQSHRLRPRYRILSHILIRHT